MDDLLPSFPFALRKATIHKASLTLVQSGRDSLAILLNIDQATFELELLLEHEPKSLQIYFTDILRCYAADFVRSGISSQEWAHITPWGVDFEGHLITVFTKLVERVACDVHLDATNVSISFLHPREGTLRLDIDDLSTRTTTREKEPQDDHKISFHGVALHMDRIIEETSDTDSRILTFGQDPATLILSQGSSNTTDINCSIGTIGSRLQSWHIARLAKLIDICICYPPASTGQFNWVDLTLSLKIRRFTVLLYHSSEGRLHLNHFFTDPSLIPQLPCGFVCFTLEDISLQLAIKLASISCVTTLGDLSLYGSIPDDDGQHTIFPILVTDRFLGDSYGSFYSHIYPQHNNRDEFRLPKFDVVDWTDGDMSANNFEQYRWRRPPNTSVQTLPALTLRVETSISTTIHDRLKLETIPLHVFVDISQILDEEILGYLTDILASLPTLKSPWASHLPTRFLEFIASTPLIRLELRCPLSGLPTRSGALVLDIHEPRFVVDSRQSAKEIMPCIGQKNGEIVIGMGARCLLIACSSSRICKANTLVSIGSLSRHNRLLTETCTYAGEVWFGMTRISETPRLTFHLVLPSIVSFLTGSTLDDLQYWCLDAAYILRVHSQSPIEAFDADLEQRSSFDSVQDVYQVLADIGRHILDARKTRPMFERKTFVFDTAVRVSIDESELNSSSCLVPYS